MLTTEQITRANALCKGTLMESLGITFVPAEQGSVAATMPVDARTHQPMGILHGGATASLAESLGSMCSHLLLEDQQRMTVGVEVNANHVRAVRSGVVKAVGRLAHQGRSVHVWDIRVANEQEELVALCRLTIMILDRRS